MFVICLFKLIFNQNVGAILWGAFRIAHGINVCISAHDVSP